MRPLLLTLLGFALALPLQAQDHTLVELSREIASPPEAVEEAAITLAKAKQYKLGIPPAGNPMMLVAGAVHLRIDETPFTLYLRSTNHHTNAYLESQKMGVSKRVKREAEAFLKEVGTRATSHQG